MEQLFVFSIGAAGYSLLEVLWRGYTHWTMAIAGGICLLLIYIITVKYNEMNFFLKCLIGMALITTVELIFGIIFNIMLKWDIWDYSGRKFSLLGQVCPFYCAMWFALCMGIIPLCRIIRSGLRFFIK